MTNFIINLFILIFGHCIADTAFQSTGMARGKNRHNPIDLSMLPAKQKPIPLWWMWMTHHAFIHGGIVALLTQNGWLGIVEFLSHWIIDFFKSEGKYNPYVDQALHIGMKIIYCLILKGSII